MARPFEETPEGLSRQALDRLLESLRQFPQRDELFEYDYDLAHDIFDRTGKRAFNVGAYTVGYTRELGTTAKVRTTVGSPLTTSLRN